MKAGIVITHSIGATDGADNKHHAWPRFEVLALTMSPDQTANFGQLRLEPDQALIEGAGRIRNSKLKRVLDVFGALAGLIFLAPLLVAAAIAIKLEGAGPVIFRQRRTGYGGRVFVLLKFRTMNVLEDGAVIIQAKQGDRRVTRIGRFLRRTSVDELPQLFNVLAGQMSLVGPRPHALAHDHYFGELIPDYGDRFLIRPGITGLAQVSGFRGETPTVACMASRIEHDLSYLTDWSICADIAILLRTLLIRPASSAAC